MTNKSSRIYRLKLCAFVASHVLSNAGYSTHSITKMLKRFSILIIHILFVSSQYSCAILGLGMETSFWKEEVTLLSGEVLLVERTMIHDPDEWQRKGKGNNSYQALSFTRKNQHYKWEAYGDDWQWGAVPLILDIINEMPVIIMPVSQWLPCSRYDFPQEGLVAFIFNENGWKRVSFTDLPTTFKLNLLHSSMGVRSSSTYDRNKIDLATKIRIERNNDKDVPKQGTSLTDIVKFYSAVRWSCSIINPPLNPTLDLLKQQITDASKNAQKVDATIVSSSESPMLVTKIDFQNTQGKWTGSGYIPDSCRNIIADIKPIIQYSVSGEKLIEKLIGETLVLETGENVPLQQPNVTAAFRMIETLEKVTCDNDIIYSIGRYSKDELIILIFSKSGSLKYALHVRIPLVNKFFPDKIWPKVWDSYINDNHLEFVLARYSDLLSSGNYKGSLLEQVRYKVTLPLN